MRSPELLRVLQRLRRLAVVVVQICVVYGGQKIRTEAVGKVVAG